MVFGPFENCRDTIDIAYKLGREAEEAKNKSRFEIYQTRISWPTPMPGTARSSTAQSTTRKLLSRWRPMTRLMRAQFAFYLANAGQFDKALDWVSWTIAHDYKTLSDLKGEHRLDLLSRRPYEEALQTLKGVEATPTHGRSR